ncbi:MAG: hypothetical protein V4584_03565 [Verrucomicrobiota bacterium]
MFGIGGAASAVPTAAQMQAYLKSRPEADEIAWKDPARGAAFTVRVVSSDATGIRVEKQLPAGMTVRTVPFSEIGSIRIAPTPAELELRRKPDAAAVEALRVIWDLGKPLVGKAEGVSETGILLAKSLRLGSIPSAYDEAEKVLMQISRYEKSPPLQSAAAAETATIAFLRTLGGTDTAAKEKLAWEITEKADDGNPDLMLLATAWLADLHFSQLKNVEAENPRWIEDLEVKPVRDKLYHLSLDFALYPSLFHGRRSAEASAGLAKAARVYEFTGENNLLKGTLEDLAALYPESSEAKDEAPLLDKLIKAETEGRLAAVEAGPQEKKTSDPASDKQPEVPAAPRRYNLFGD